MLKNGKDYNHAYEALEQELRQNIYARRLRAGQKLHSEIQFAYNYRISRSSVRKALAVLESEGLIRKLKGSGTFVMSENERVAREMSAPTGKYGTDRYSFSLFPHGSRKTRYAVRAHLNPYSTG